MADGDDEDVWMDEDDVAVDLVVDDSAGNEAVNTGPENGGREPEAGEPAEQNAPQNENILAEVIINDLLGQLLANPHPRSSRRLRSLDTQDPFFISVDECTSKIRGFAKTRQRDTVVTEQMKILVELIQQGFEEFLGGHRDPAQELVFSANEKNSQLGSKILLIINKLHAIEEEEGSFYETLCIHYLIGASNDPDLQYYTCIVLYAIAQGFSPRTVEDADHMQLFFQTDSIFFPMIHLMSLNPEPNPTIALPTKNAREIRTVLCGIFGTLFERAELSDHTSKFSAIRQAVMPYAQRLRDYSRIFKPVVPVDSRSENPIFAVPAAPPVNVTPRSAAKRRLDRNRSIPDSSTPSSSKRKRPRISYEIPRFDIDENSSCSSWLEYERLQVGDINQNFRLFPMDETLEIRFIFDLFIGLSTMPHFSTMFYEFDVLDLCNDYLDVRKRLNIRILGQVVHLLGNILASQRFVTKFLENPLRLHQLIKIPVPSIPSVFVVKVCMNVALASEYTLETLVKYTDLVHLLAAFMVNAGINSGHESARKWAARFFFSALKFRNFMDAFDDPKVDGLRSLLNLIGCYDYFWKEEGELERQFSMEEQLLSAAEALLHAFQALCQYFITDMAIKADRFRQELIRKAKEEKKELLLDAKFMRILPNKAIHSEDIDDVRDFMLSHVPLCRFPRDRVARFCKLDGVNRLLQLLSTDNITALNKRGYSVVAFHQVALEILEKCMLSYAGQDAVLNHVIPEKSYPYTGIGLLLEIALKYTVADPNEEKKVPEIKKLVLHVISNCVYGLRTGRDEDELEVIGRRSGLKPFYNDPVHFEKMVEVLRQYRCVEVMRHILIDSSDGFDEILRALACQILAGMARSASCKQMMRELSFFRDDELQVMMRTPLTLDSDKYYQRFERCGRELLEILFDTKLKCPVPVHLVDAVRRQDILKRTQITFSSQEVDHFLVSHFLQRGLADSAECLKKETGLEDSSLMDVKKKNTSRRSLIPGVIKVDNLAHIAKGDINGQVTSTSHDSLNPSNVSSNNGVPSLFGIVASNFHSQHAQCEYPVTLCAPFSLSHQHRCYAPSKLLKPSENISFRYGARGGRYDSHRWGRGLDRKYLFGRYKQIANLEYSHEYGVFEPEGGIVAADFLGSQQKNLIVGNTSGHIVFYNVNDITKPVHHQICHEFECEIHYIAAIPTAQDLFVSCCSSEVATIWRYDGAKKSSMVDSYPETDYMAFPHQHTTFSLGRDLNDLTSAFLIDLERKAKVSTFHNPELQACYTKNCPSFHPSDDLITHDGLLYDRRANQHPLHKFDRFERHTSNGVFHPNGNVIIIDEQVWDLRMFKLLKSVPTFNQSMLCFNGSGDVIYSIHLEKHADEYSEFPGTFTTVDSRDYSNIAGVDFKKKFQCFAIDSLDNFLFMGDNYNMSVNTFGRLFQIGLEKSEEDEIRDEEEPVSEYGDDDDDDGDDDLDMFDDEEIYDEEDMYSTSMRSESEPEEGNNEWTDTEEDTDPFEENDEEEDDEDFENDHE